MPKIEWCGPFALHIITGKSYDDCVNILKQTSIGDYPVIGVWIGAMVNALKSQGFRLNMMRADGRYRLSSFKSVKGLFLCEVNRHFVVMKDGVMFDNAHPNGSEPTRHSVLRAYEVIKDDGIL